MKLVAALARRLPDGKQPCRTAHAIAVVDRRQELDALDRAHQPAVAADHVRELGAGDTEHLDHRAERDDAVGVMTVDAQRDDRNVATQVFARHGSPNESTRRFAAAGGYRQCRRGGAL
jgi:hypothetical protein